MNQQSITTLASAIALLLASSSLWANTSVLSTVEVNEREQLLASGITPEELYSLPESFANSVQM